MRNYGVRYSRITRIFAIHTQNRSQFAPLASEIPEWRRDASPLVFVIRAILSYIRISSGLTNANADGMSRQCGQCQRPDCPVSAMDSPVPDTYPETKMVNQPFAASEIGESMDADLLPELSGETWVASALIEEFTADLLPAGSNVDLITAKMTRWQQCGVDSVKIHSGMGGLCWALSGIALLTATSRKFVD